MGSLYNPLAGNIYLVTISGIYCQLGDYMLPIPPFTFEPENPLSLGFGSCWIHIANLFYPLLNLGLECMSLVWRNV